MGLGWGVLGIYLMLCLFSKSARKELGSVIGEVWAHAEFVRLKCSQQRSNDQ